MQMRNNKLALVRDNKLLLAALMLLLSFLYALPIANKLWHPYDEGWVLTNADLVSQGAVPYRDFWTLNSPGQFYLLALLFKIFGKSLTLVRIYIIVLHSLICFTVFLIASRLCKFKYAVFGWFICTVSLVPRLGAIPSTEWPAVFFALSSLMALSIYIERKDHPWLMLAGLCASLAFLFRHDFGIYTLLAGGFVVLLLSINRRTPKPLFSFLAPVAVILSSVFYYFARNSALPYLFNQLFYFPLKVYSQTRGIRFPKFCFNPNMLFHRGMYFINVNQFYIPIIVILLTLTILLYRFYKKVFKNTDFILAAVSLTGLFHLNYVRVRSDIMHLIPIMPFAIILFVYLLSRIYDLDYFRQRNWLRRTVVITASVFIGSFMVKNIDVYTKHAIRRPLQGRIKFVKFALGGVYIPKDQAQSVQQTVSFVRENTAKNEKIFVGNTSHAETQGTNTIIYFLAERLPATKYYMFEPGLTDQSQIQEEMIQSIEKEVNLIVLVGVPQTETQTQAPLDKYLKNRFRLVKDFGQFYIYKKR